MLVVSYKSTNFDQRLKSSAATRRKIIKAPNLKITSDITPF